MQEHTLPEWIKPSIRLDRCKLDFTAAELKRTRVRSRTAPSSLIQYPCQSCLAVGQPHRSHWM